MAHSYGLETFPVANAAAGYASGDRALTIVADFLKAVILSRAGAAYLAISGNVPIVKAAFPHDPEEHQFSAASLPALYVFRDGEPQYEQMAEDLRVGETTIRVWWIYQPTTQSKQAKRAPFVNAVSKAVDFAVNEGRDPAYLLAGDTDPLTPTEGSLIVKVADFMSFAVVKSGKKVVRIAVNGGDPMPFDALEVLISVREHAEYDLTQFDLLNGINVDLKNSSGAVIGQARFNV